MQNEPNTVSEQENDPAEYNIFRKGVDASSYHGPVARLLASPPVFDKGEIEPVNYLQSFGITSEHIPELIRMATDPLLYSEDATEEQYDAPCNAVRALAELRAVSALEPLLAFR